MKCSGCCLSLQVGEECDTGQSLTASAGQATCPNP